ncbi:MAG: GtrA family protein [Bacteroidales bacterium]|nr:GtrA family protein [Bacteroidales bacterium]
MKLNTLLTKHKNFIIYCLIGCINTIVDFSIFTLLTYWGLYYIISHVISYHCGILCSFFLNRHFNFKVKDKTFRRFLSFYGISLIALCSSAALLYLFVDVLCLGCFITDLLPNSNFILDIFHNYLAFNKIVGKLIATIIIVVLQFLFVKTYTFKQDK